MTIDFMISLLERVFRNDMYVYKSVCECTEAGGSRLPDCWTFGGSELPDVGAGN